MQETPIKLLIVDDEAEITRTMSEYFAERYPEKFTALTTNNPLEVIPLLKQHRDVRVVICDFRMPDLNGFDLLIEVKKTFPSVFFIMMSGYGTRELWENARRSGAVRYVEKPFRMSEIVKIIDELIKSQDSGFTGFIDELELPEIIQFLSIAGSDVCLSIEAEGQSGNLYFTGGEMIHAATGDFEGEQAFYEIFLWRRGRFTASGLPDDVPRTIIIPVQGLLLEAARLEDEKKAMGKIEEQAGAEADHEEVVEEDIAVDDVRIEDQKRPVEASDDSTGRYRPDEPAIPAQGEEAFSAGQDERETTDDIQFVPHPETKEILFDANERENLSQGAVKTAEDSEAAEETDVDIFPDEHHYGEEPAGENAEGLLPGEIPSLVNPIVDTLMRHFPANFVKVRFRRLPLPAMPESLRRFLVFRLHQVSTSAIRYEDVPFDFNNERVSRAASELVQAILETWEVDVEFFRGLLDQAVQFHFAYAVHPARALARIIRDFSGGSLERARTTLTSMAVQGIVDSDLGRLHLTDVAAPDEGTVSLEQIETVLQKLIVERGEERALETVTTSVDNLLALAALLGENAKQKISAELLALTARFHGLEDFARSIETQSEGNNSFTSEDVRQLTFRFRESIQR